MLHAAPGQQAAHEPVTLAQAAHRSDGLFVHQPEVTGVRYHRHGADPVDDPVKQRGGIALPARLAGAGDALADHDLIALVPLLHHLRNQRRRVLQIGVQQHDRLAGGVIDAGGERLLLAEIAAEFDSADAAVLRMPIAEPGEGVVLAAVVDGDDFPVVGDGFKYRYGGLEERIGGGRFVIHGHDDR